MTIFLSLKSLTIQSKKKIIFEKNFIKEDSDENAKNQKYINMFFDLYIDEENKYIIYGLKVGGKIKLYKITFDSLHKTILAKIKNMTYRWQQNPEPNESTK